MRITDIQKDAFIDAIREMGIQKFELYLFGSRTNDQLKGGDIDLLLISSDANISFLKSNRHILLAKMKMKTEDERIDLTLLTDSQKTTDPFFNSLTSQNLVPLR